MTQIKDLNGIHVEGHIKISDPSTGEVHLYHRLNLETGMYRGVQVLEPKNAE